MRAYVVAARPMTTNAAPATSIRRLAPGSVDSGTWRDASSTTTASGRFNRKISRQETADTNQPPTNGPIAVVIPPSPDQAPIARPRSDGAKLDSMRARLPGTRSAPPMPCNARAAISIGRLTAIPHSSDARLNHTTPIVKIRLRPNRSPSDPPSRISAARVIR